MSNNYVCLINFGKSAGNNPQNDPTSYCAVSNLDNSFSHTLGSSYLTRDSPQCQIFMAQRCAEKWDDICEIESLNKERIYPNVYSSYDSSTTESGIGTQFTKGEYLIRNTAEEKYLVAMNGNCIRVYEPFDPTVPNSPFIGRWKPDYSKPDNSLFLNGKSCFPVYDVDPSKIDNDPVMDKLLNNLNAGSEILLSIYKKRKRENKLGELKGTKLGNFFDFLQSKGI